MKPLFDQTQLLSINVYEGHTERSIQKDGSHVDYSSSACHMADTSPKATEDLVLLHQKISCQKIVTGIPA